MFIFYFDIKSVITENQIFDGVTVDQHYYKKWQNNTISKKLQKNFTLEATDKTSETTNGRRFTALL